MSHVYENPVETEVDQVARILFSLSIEIYARYICARSSVQCASLLVLQ